MKTVVLTEGEIFDHLEASYQEHGRGVIKIMVNLPPRYLSRTGDLYTDLPPLIETWKRMILQDGRVAWVRHGEFS